MIFAQSQRHLAQSTPLTEMLFNKPARIFEEILPKTSFFRGKIGRISGTKHQPKTSKHVRRQRSRDVLNAYRRYLLEPFLRSLLGTLWSLKSATIDIYSIGCRIHGVNI